MLFPFLRQRPRRKHRSPIQSALPSYSRNISLPIFGWSLNRRLPRSASLSAMSPSSAAHMERVSSHALPTSQPLGFRQRRPVVWPPRLANFRCRWSGQAGLYPRVKIDAAVAHQFLARFEVARASAFRSPQPQRGLTDSNVFCCLNWRKRVLIVSHR